MKVSVITPHSTPYPSLKNPQYLDYDNIFEDLSTRARITLYGNIVAKRAYAVKQYSYPSIFGRFPLIWRNRVTASFTSNSLLSGKLKSLDSFVDTLFARFCVEKMKGNLPDVLYSFPHPPDRYVIKIARNIRRPLVIEMWEDYVQFSVEVMLAMNLPPSAIDRQIKTGYKWMADIANGSSAVIVPTLVFKNLLLRLGVCPGKIHVIPVCIKQAINPPSILNRPAREGEKIVFHVGSSTPWHDFQTFSESLEYVKSNILAVIVGEKPQMFRESIRNPKVRVLFTGKLPAKELESYLYGSDICVAPFDFHGLSGFFPGKVIRYMLACKAVIATDLPEIREMFMNKEAGLLVPKKDPYALAKALDTLISDDKRRMRFGLTGYTIARNNYLIKHHTEQLLKVFNEVIP